ncbi:MAG: Gmad2 immunoglobulin-like domain-containing protein [Anaerolineae bacterium]
MIKRLVFLLAGMLLLAACGSPVEPVETLAAPTAIVETAVPTAAPTDTPIESPWLITIDSPEEGAQVPAGQPVQIEGWGAALFEGTVGSEVLAEDGSVITQTFALVDSPEAGTGGEGPWTVSIDVPDQPGSTITVRAYATSPRDGSVVTEDTVTLTVTE